jgi:hypothetical protein
MVHLLVLDPTTTRSCFSPGKFHNLFSYKQSGIYKALFRILAGIKSTPVTLVSIEGELVA